jgi:hypothetical protein
MEASAASLRKHGECIATTLEPSHTTLFIQTVRISNNALTLAFVRLYSVSDVRLHHLPSSAIEQAETTSPTLTMYL